MGIQTYYDGMKKISSIGICVLVLACQSSKEPPAAVTPAESTLAGSMQNLKSNLSHLLPIILNPEQFNAVQNHERIETDVKNLVDISKQVNHSASMASMDPSLRFISTAFSQDLARAQESLELGKREFARYTLLNVTAYCIECHTRTSAGPSFTTPELEKTLQSLSPMARGEFLLSTRQFDKAFLEFESVIQSLLSGGTRMFELDKAVRYSLAISVKFQKDPKKSLEIVKLIQTASKAPYYLKQDAHAWEISIKEWQNEKKAKIPVDVLKVSESLLKAGHSAQLGSSNRGGEIYFLRAISELNNFLRTDLDKEKQGHALFLMGTAYESVGDVSIWSLHEDYYESCIRTVPHTKWAERCYTKLEESSYLGFTGTAGVQLPVDIEMKLDQLHKLAF